MPNVASRKLCFRAHVSAATLKPDGGGCLPDCGSSFRAHVSAATLKPVE